MTDERVANQNESSHKIAIDPVRLNMFHERLRSQQNLVGGVIAGAVAACVGAILWAVITVVTGYQIGFMAVGVGFLVGLALQRFGRGVDSVFGMAGAILALLGCLAGNLFAICGYISKFNDVPIFGVLAALDPGMAKDVMIESFSPMDLLFYGIAVYEGYKLSFRRLTQTDLESIMPGA
jgi:hypothetical protein